MRNSELREHNIVAEKSKQFALRTIQLYQYLRGEKREYILARQVLRSGTSIGANIREAGRGQSRADFYAKLSIALKEADETAYWLELLYEGGYLERETYESIYEECQELIRLLASITKTLKSAEQAERQKT